MNKPHLVSLDENCDWWLFGGRGACSECTGGVSMLDEAKGKGCVLPSV